MDTDTIVALATPPGRGGIGVVRISGPATQTIARAITHTALTPRYAHYGNFFAADGDDIVDCGIALLFPAPHSFTGEDVLELHAHGSPVLLDQLIDQIRQLGARLARPGEFSQRAFLNNKIDLTQAEAIADLIDSASQQAAKNALRSLQGVFSEKIQQLLEQLVQLRVYVEAALDFPEEEIDFLNNHTVSNGLQTIIDQLQTIFQQARQGVVVREGMRVVIAGEPNAGKSSLLNALSGSDSAIVSAHAGTTRDVLREQIHIDGMPLHIIDTAGLRASSDPVEQEGIRRAWQEIEQADRILLVVDSDVNLDVDPAQLWPDFIGHPVPKNHLTIVQNKIDLSMIDSGISEGEPAIIRLSAKTGDGLPLLRQHLMQCMGYTGTTEGSFTARQRHIDALERAMAALQQGQKQLQSHGAGELMAEDLRQCQQCLGEITGEFTSDDLLGAIFANFCIGK